MKKVLATLMFISGFLYCQDKTQKIDNSPMPITTSPANELVGTWDNNMPLFELYGNIYEKGNIKNERFQDTKFISEIIFKSDNRGQYAFSDNKDTGDKSNQKVIEFEYQIRDNNVLVIAYGSLLDPKIDMYKYFKTSNGDIFLYSTKMSFTVGKFYMYLKQNNSNVIQNNSAN